MMPSSVSRMAWNQSGILHLAILGAMLACAGRSFITMASTAS